MYTQNCGHGGISNIKDKSKLKIICSCLFFFLCILINIFLARVYIFSQAMREKEQERYANRFKYSLIRIRFPDGLYLQVSIIKVFC